MPLFPLGRSLIDPPDPVSPSQSPVLGARAFPSDRGRSEASSPTASPSYVYWWPYPRWAQPTPISLSLLGMSGRCHVFSGMSGGGQCVSARLVVPPGIVDFLSPHPTSPAPPISASPLSLPSEGPLGTPPPPSRLTWFLSFLRFPASLPPGDSDHFSSSLVPGGGTGGEFCAGAISSFSRFLGAYQLQAAPLRPTLAPPKTGSFRVPLFGAEDIGRHPVRSGTDGDRYITLKWADNEGFWG